MRRHEKRATDKLKKSNTVAPNTMPLKGQRPEFKKKRGNTGRERAVKDANGGEKRRHHREGKGLNNASLFQKKERTSAG